MISPNQPTLSLHHLPCKVIAQHFGQRSAVARRSYLQTMHLVSILCKACIRGGVRNRAGDRIVTNIATNLATNDPQHIPIFIHFFVHDEIYRSPKAPGPKRGSKYRRIETDAQASMSTTDRKLLVDIARPYVDRFGNEFFQIIECTSRFMYGNLSVD